MESQKILTLKAHEVHIWSASLLRDKNNIDYYHSILSKDERKRIGGFRFARDQRRFTTARGILRCLLSNYLGQSPENIEIIYGLWGKPCLLDEKSLYFNLSHSGDYALYAVTRSCEVGVDLEYIDQNLELEDLAVHIFSATELIEWKNLEPEPRINSFFKRWVSKEAFLKASGKGWLEDKYQLTFNFKNELRKKNLHDDVSNPYCFECIPGYASALFCDGAIIRPLHFDWNKSILENLRRFKQNL